MLKTSFLSIATLVLVLYAINAVSGQGSQETFTAKYIGENRLAMLFGGDWECGCETESEPCAQSPILCISGTCHTCESEAQKEHCVGWGICIPYVTCSDCVWDNDHDCGRENVSVCEDMQCPFGMWYGTCETVAQCHTD